MEIPNKKAKPLLPNELFDFHFREDWKMRTGASFALFHINRLEEVLPDMKFPVRPHRKTIHDFIFLSEGASKRSKNLHEYEFSDTFVCI
jgi:AraC family transcriptional regulator, transcriptional activator of pobA